MKRIRLPPHWRRVRSIRGFEMSEPLIATFLGCSRGLVSQLLNSAYRKLARSKSRRLREIVR